MPFINGCLLPNFETRALWLPDRCTEAEDYAAARVQSPSWLKIGWPARCRWRTAPALLADVVLGSAVSEHFDGGARCSTRLSGTQRRTGRSCRVGRGGRRGGTLPQSGLTPPSHVSDAVPQQASGAETTIFTVIHVAESPGAEYQ
jgi:hypothetical protein